jgi:hypothetical protein
VTTNHASNKQQATSKKQQATSNKEQAISNKQQATSNKQQAALKISKDKQTHTDVVSTVLYDTAS